MSDIYTIIVCSLKKGNYSLKAVWNILINSVGEVDYSAQETCHVLLQLPLIKASRDFTVVNLDGSCVIEYHLQEIERASLSSFLDHYLVPPTTPLFNDINLLQFIQQHTVSKIFGSVPKHRSESGVVVIHPYYPPDPAGLQYEQYCHLFLMKHEPFYQLSAILAERILMLKLTGYICSLTTSHHH